MKKAKKKQVESRARQTEALLKPPINKTPTRVVDKELDARIANAEKALADSGRVAPLPRFMKDLTGEQLYTWWEEVANGYRSDGWTFDEIEPQSQNGWNALAVRLNGMSNYEWHRKPLA